ncbi:hypothetical protein BJV78DRAFT_1167458, partial [Lactifluus subvellereus]
MDCSCILLFSLTLPLSLLSCIARVLHHRVVKTLVLPSLRLMIVLSFVQRLSVHIIPSIASQDFGPLLWDDVPDRRQGAVGCHLAECITYLPNHA